MHKNRFSAPSSPILTPSDNKADSSNGSRSGTLASTRRVGSSPSDSYQVSNPNPGLSHGSPLHPTSKKGGNTPQPSGFFAHPWNILLFCLLDHKSMAKNLNQVLLSLLVSFTSLILHLLLLVILRKQILIIILIYGNSV
ncbi:hypothetical protein NC652_033920 [Populus alba x Populus x berolinensis]|nr:hypothetical protein NC652_033920 [Populus alba x Populus x berolinensis]